MVIIWGHFEMLARCRSLHWIVFVGFMLSHASTAEAGLLTAQDVTVNVGGDGTIDVIWSTTQPLNYLSTQFVIRAVTGASAGAIFVADGSSVPPISQITNNNYVFFGDSSATGNPASVTQDAWANDSYIMADLTSSGNDYTQNGTRIWTTMKIQGITAGTYQIGLVSSEYDTTTNSSGSAIPLTDADLTGGLITVTGGAAVPEPSTLLIGASILGLVARRSRMRRQARPAALT